MRPQFLAAFAMTLLSASVFSVARADDSSSYVEGTVTEVTAIRIKPGKFDAYMKWLDTTGKQLREDEKKAGIIVDYAVFQSLPRDAHDADVILTVTYKNMAAFDELQARTDPAVKEIFGSLPKAASASADREKLRKQLGSQLVRQLVLK